MTKQELLLIAQLLDMAADQFSNHGCNDFELPMTQENVDLLNEIEQDNVGEGNEPEWVVEFKPGAKLYTQDSILMRYLSRRAAGEAE